MIASTGSGTARLLHAILLAIGGVLLFDSTCARASSYAVNDSADLPDLVPGDGDCDATNGKFVCTLRAAVQEANAHAGPDSITLPGDTTYLLTRAGVDDSASYGDLDIIDTLTLSSTEPNTVIDGNGDVTGDRVLQVSKCLGSMVVGDSSCTGESLQMDISGITFRNGKPAGLGGGIRNHGNLTVRFCSIIGNGFSGTFRYGGGIFNAGILNLNDSEVSDNTTGANDAWGGGIYNAGVANVARSTVSGNSAVGSSTTSGAGGGINNVGQLLVSDSTISGNIAGDDGGGIYSTFGDARMERSTVSGNRSRDGGGIFKFASSMTLVNTTISGNSSDNDGGGIFNHVGIMKVFSSTIARNRANADGLDFATGGGIHSFSGSFTLMNSIVAANEKLLSTLPSPSLVFDDCAGGLVSEGSNLLSEVDENSCSIAGEYTLALPNVGPLQDNGGPTLTHALLPDSVAIDAGSADGCADDLAELLNTDQRHLPRAQGTACDMGAFEFQDDVFRDGFEP